MGGKVSKLQYPLLPKSVDAFERVKLRIAAARFPLRSDPAKASSCAPTPKAGSGFLPIIVNGYGNLRRA